MELDYKMIPDTFKTIKFIHSNAQTPDSNINAKSEADKIRYYCECCGKPQFVIIESLESGCGDILCKECHFVIATRFKTGYKNG